MNDTPSDNLPNENPAPALYLERTGIRQYIARNARGAEVRVGDGPGCFTPGDLLKLAIAGCNAMSSDIRLAGTLGEDFAQFIGVSGQYNEEADRFESFQVELVQDLSGLDDETRDSMLRRAEKAIDRNCTIGHSFEHPMPYTRAFVSENLSEDS
ncbi:MULTISPECIES: OsmC family protein [unclassified Schaalia]|uniref:OsmC family protein n=1 Tax=unclassified Schaalia TaxID=2691889 RepID=UPI001E4BB387|nr:MULTISPECIES: OsmC family protein [unclassified Schaalia]MCD4550244.1 OsmC family protein [Schaalia sp. lx-260]MCD4558136.1 OsmC family protein [Schaalia sp. lx-100]